MGTHQEAKGVVWPAFPWGSGHRVRLYVDQDGQHRVEVVRRRDWTPGDPDHVPGIWDVIHAETHSLERIAKKRRQKLYETYCRQPIIKTDASTVYEPSKGETRNVVGQKTLF